MKILRSLCGLLLCASAIVAQTYVISTVAGGAPIATPAGALTTSFGIANSVAAGSGGAVFFASGNSVFKIDSQGSVTRVAGNSRAGYSGDGGPAVNAQLSGPLQLAADASGNLFITDRNNSRIRRVSSDGIIATVAGTGANGFSGDGGPAVNAQFDNPDGIAIDAAGNLFIADRNNARIRKVATSGVISTIAGTTSGFAGDGGQATSAKLASPDAVALDGAGNLFIADSSNARIRKIATNGTISTVAGNGTLGFPVEGASATSSSIRTPYGVAADSSGNVFIADPDSARVWKVSIGGTIGTFAGGSASFSGDGGQAAGAGIGYPSGIAMDGAGNLFIVDTANQRIRKVDTTGIITTVMGNGSGAIFLGDGGAALSATLASPYGVGVDGAGNVFIADSNNNRVRKVTPAGIITTVAGNGTEGFSGDGGAATSAQLFRPFGVAVNAAGELFIADFANFRIRKVSTTGVITTVAGNGTRGFGGDNGPAISAQLDSAIALAIDGSGNLLIADAGNNRIRKVTPSGTITTVAGNGTAGSGGDGGPALSAQISTPESITVDAAGNFYLTDDSARVRKVASNGIISTVAGSSLGGSGDGGPATQAQMSNVIAVAVDGAGNLFIVDTANQRVRKVDTGGTINTIAGSGNPGFYGDGGAGTGAGMNDPYGLAVDSSGNVYVADRDNNAVRKLTPSNQATFISAVLDSASESATPVSPGKIVAIYGSGLGPAVGLTAPVVDNAFGTTLAGTTVSFNGVLAPVIYAGDAQVIAIVPYATSGTTANVVVSTPKGVSAAFSVPVAASSPGFFTSNSTGAGQAASINAIEGTLNTATSPTKIGGYISLYLTGEGQLTVPGADGKLWGNGPVGVPVLPVTATVDGITAFVQYKGGVYGAVAGLMQVNVQIPTGVKAGGYVPVIVTVGSASTTSAVWIAVSAN